MISYSKPLCKTGSTFVKSRCECKTLSKNKKLTSRKTLKIRKSSKYDEEWATTSGKYMIRMPSQHQLKVRRRRIDEVHKLHKMIKKFRPNEISLGEWAYPPQYCYLEQLLNIIKYMKRDLKIYSKGNI